MKKLFTFMLLALLCCAGNAWGDVIYSFTLSSSSAAIGTYTATGGTATVSGSAFPTGGTNEVTVGSQTFYKFNSSSTIRVILSSTKLDAGDVLTFTCASNASSAKNGKGIIIGPQGSEITLKGNFAAGATNTLTYTVAAGDALVGKDTFLIKRADSDIKFGTVVIERTASSPVCPSGLTITGTQNYYEGENINLKANLTAGNGTINFQWYKGSVAAGNEIAGATSSSLTINSCSLSDAGNYYCVVSKADCDTLTSSAYAVSVAEMKWLAKAVFATSTTATVTGSMSGATADVSVSSSGKLDKDKYFGIKAANGETFQTGDIVNLHFTTAGSGSNWYVFNNKVASAENQIYSSETGSTATDLTFTLTSDQTAIYLVRDGTGAAPYGLWNPTMGYIEVVRPTYHSITYEGTKGADMSAYPTRYAEGVGIASFADLADVEGWDFAGWSPASIGTDATTDQTITATWTAAAQKWDVTFNMQGHGAAIDAQKVNDGETATEPAVPTDGAYTFGGWYTEATCANAFDFATTITANVELFAKWTAKPLSSSINIEQNVLDNKKTWNVKGALDAANITYVDVDALDSLDDSKASRNEPYLGLKFKKSTSSFTVVLASGSTVKVKFGNIGCKVKVTGLETKDIATNADKVYSYTATEAGALTFSLTDAKTVVLKQIMIDEDIKEVELPVVTASVSSVGWASLYLTYDAEIPEGVTVYYASAVNSSAVTLTQVENNLPKNTGVIITATEGDYTFNMASAAVTAIEGNLFEGVAKATACEANANYVLSGESTADSPIFGLYTGTTLGANKAYLPESKVPSGASGAASRLTFVIGTDNPIVTGLEAVASEGKAVKFLKDGQLFILKNGKVFNAAGQVVK